MPARGIGSDLLCELTLRRRAKYANQLVRSPHKRPFPAKETLQYCSGP